MTDTYTREEVTQLLSDLRNDLISEIYNRLRLESTEYSSGSQVLTLTFNHQKLSEIEIN